MKKEERRRTDKRDRRREEKDCVKSNGVETKGVGRKMLNCIWEYLSGTNSFSFFALEKKKRTITFFFDHTIPNFFCVCVLCFYSFPIVRILLNSHLSPIRVGNLNIYQVGLVGYIHIIGIRRKINVEVGESE
jgi:hypothetical protein